MTEIKRLVEQREGQPPAERCGHPMTYRALPSGQLASPPQVQSSASKQPDKHRKPERAHLDQEPRGSVVNNQRRAEGLS